MWFQKGRLSPWGCSSSPTPDPAFWRSSPVSGLGIGDRRWASYALSDEAPEVVALVATGCALLDELARTGADAGVAIEAMTPKPTRTAGRILVEAATTILERGEVPAAELAATKALGIAEVLGSPSLRARAHFALGTIAQQRGNLESALAHYAAMTDFDGDARLAMRARVRRSEVLRATGRAEEAARDLDDVAVALEESEAFADASEARRQHAILAREARDFSRAEALAQESLALARRAGDGAAETQALLCLGSIAWRQGNVALAQDAFQRALPLAESSGNVRGITSAVGNLALLNRERGDFASSIAPARKALAIAERFGQKRLAASLRQNLGVYCLEAGDIDAARGSLELASEQIRSFDLGFWTMSQVNLGWLEIHEGSFDAARERLLVAIGTGGQANAEAAGDARWLLGLIAIRRGEWDEAATMADAVAGAAGDPGSRLAQSLALRTSIVLAHGSASSARVDELAGAFEERSPRPEVHELPIDVLLDLARASKSEERATVVAQAVRLLAGRPHPRSSEIAALTDEHAIAS